MAAGIVSLVASIYLTHQEEEGCLLGAVIDLILLLFEDMLKCLLLRERK
jgi:hypothetical protein